MKQIGLGLVWVAAIVGCGSGTVSVADLQAKCTRVCQRANSTCGGSEDCSQDCAIDTTQPAVCTNEFAAVFDCANGLSDTDLCANSDARCASQESAASSCIAAASTHDAGATSDTGTP